MINWGLKTATRLQSFLSEFFASVDRDRAIGAKNAEILKYAKQDQILKTIHI